MTLLAPESSEIRIRRLLPTDSGGTCSKLCETLRKEGEVERDRIIEAAHEAAGKIKTQAGFSADQEFKKAISLIKKETADAAVALAEKILKKDIKKEDQKKLVSEYLESLGDAR